MDVRSRSETWLWLQLRAAELQCRKGIAGRAAWSLGSGNHQRVPGQSGHGFPAQWMINVEDDAKIQIACLADKTVNGERLLRFAHPFDWNDVLAVIRRLRPQATTVEDTKGQQRDWSTVDNERGAELSRKLWDRMGIAHSRRVRGTTWSLWSRESGALKGMLSAVCTYLIPSNLESAISMCMTTTYSIHRRLAPLFEIATSHSFACFIALRIFACAVSVGSK